MASTYIQRELVFKKRCFLLEYHYLICKIMKLKRNNANLIHLVRMLIIFVILELFKCRKHVTTFVALPSAQARLTVA